MPDASLRQRLADLIAFDTQNPSGDEGAMVAYLAQQLGELGASQVERFTVGKHHAVLARFGQNPRLLLNAHIDTVPANAGYTAPPHQLVEREGRYYGLGTADTKGAIAAILEALRERGQSSQASQGGQSSQASHGGGQSGTGSPRDLAVLFSGDEEKGASVMRWFLGDGRGKEFERAIVCEPTGLRVGHRHRGIAASTARTVSAGGHSSRADEMPSPIVTLARAAVALHEHGQACLTKGPAGFRGLCLNVAGIWGGLAFNVIPAQAELQLSVRPAPGSDTAAILAELEAVARAAVGTAPLVWENTHVNPPFATRDLQSFVPLLGEAAQSPLDLGFWTEAALFAEAGVDAVVFGPGDITEAHGADEFVEIAQLEGALDTFRSIAG